LKLSILSDDLNLTSRANTSPAIQITLYDELVRYTFIWKSLDFWYHV